MRVKRRYEKLSISLPKKITSKLDKLLANSEFSRSEVISKLLEFGLHNISEISDLEPLRVNIDWPERSHNYDIELNSDEEIVIKTPVGGFRISPFKEGDFLDIFPLKRYRIFERVSLYNTIPNKDDSRLGKYVGSASLICLKLATIPRENIDNELLYSPAE